MSSLFNVDSRFATPRHVLLSPHPHLPGYREMKNSLGTHWVSGKPGSEQWAQVLQTNLAQSSHFETQSHGRLRKHWPEPSEE